MSSDARCQEEEALRSFLDYLKTTSPYAEPAMRNACNALLSWHGQGGAIDRRAFAAWKQAIVEQLQAYQALEAAFMSAEKPKEARVSLIQGQTANQAGREAASDEHV